MTKRQFTIYTDDFKQEAEALFIQQNHFVVEAAA